MPRSPLIPKMRMLPFGSAYLYPRSPWAAMWWSVLLPGFGHLFVGSHLKGVILSVWEAVVNRNANLNLAIYYTIVGEPARAAEVLRLEWAILYPLIYFFAIWDSYRVCVEMNQLCQLEELQPERYFARISMHPLFGMDFLDKRSPFVAAFFSLLAGGLGHLYNLRPIKALVLTAWQAGTLVLANGHKAIALTLQGQYGEAAGVLDYEWFLFWPSITLFTVVNAYTDAIELNNLFDEEWEYRLRPYIRNPAIPRPKG